MCLKSRLIFSSHSDSFTQVNVPDSASDLLKKSVSLFSEVSKKTKQKHYYG